jgi:hypothetical protein
MIFRGIWASTVESHPLYFQGVVGKSQARAIDRFTKIIHVELRCCNRATLKVDFSK